MAKLGKDAKAQPNIVRRSGWELAAPENVTGCSNPGDFHGEEPQKHISDCRPPLHPIFVTLPIALLVAAFVCDLIYWSGRNPFWATAAYWSLAAGIVTAALAAVGGLIDFLGDRRIRDLRDAWYHFLANGLAVVIAIYNFFLRYRDGAEAAVLQWGIWLSVLVLLILIFSGWKGGELVFRHRVGVLDDPK